eukprot:scaffold5084_cov385-Prasinococcus_capsulatus_cf.AAC.3
MESGATSQGTPDISRHDLCAFVEEHLHGAGPTTSSVCHGHHPPGRCLALCKLVEELLGPGASVTPLTATTAAHSAGAPDPPGSWPGLGNRGSAPLSGERTPPQSPGQPATARPPAPMSIRGAASATDTL